MDTAQETVDVQLLSEIERMRRALDLMQEFIRNTEKERLEEEQV